jgi:hypothetical protein
MQVRKKALPEKPKISAADLPAQKCKPETKQAQLQ